MQMKKMIHENTLFELLLEDSVLEEGVKDTIMNGIAWAASGIKKLLEKFGDTSAGKLLAKLLNTNKSKAHAIERENDALLAELFSKHPAWHSLIEYGATKNAPGTKDGLWFNMLGPEDQQWVTSHLQNSPREFSYLLGQIYMWKQKNLQEKDEWFRGFVDSLSDVEAAIGSAAGQVGDITTAASDLSIKLGEFTQEAVDKSATALGEVALLVKYAVKFFKAFCLI